MPKRRTPLRTVEAHQGWVRAVAVSPDGKLLATCGNDNLVKLWNAADGTLVDELRGPREPRLQRRLSSRRPRRWSRAT